MVIVLDSNILVYAAGRDHPLKDPCMRVFEAIVEGEIEATTTTLVIDEFVHVYARRRDRATGVRHAEEFLTLLSPLLPIEEIDVRPALRLFERFERLDASDGFLAAATIRADAEALISADQAFADVPRLRFVDPSGAALDELIGSS